MPSSAVPAHAANLDLLLASQVAFECRTTVYWRDYDLDAVKRLALGLAECGVTHYALQLARPDQCLDPAYAAPAACPGEDALAALVETLAPRFQRLELRR